MTSQVSSCTHKFREQTGCVSFGVLVRQSYFKQSVPNTGIYFLDDLPNRFHAAPTGSSKQSR